MKSDHTEDLKFVKLKDVNYQQMLLEVKTTFWKHDLFCHYLDLTPEDLHPIYDTIIKKCVQSDLSLACVNQKGETVSVITNIPHRDYEKIIIPKQRSIKTDPLIEMLDAIEQAYPSKDPQSAIVSYTWSTRQDYTRKGIVRDMMEIVMKDAKDQGYKTIIADCMNIKSKGAAKKLGFVSEAEIFYYPYTLKNGKTPFKDLPKDQSVARMIKYL